MSSAAAKKAKLAAVDDDEPQLPLGIDDEPETAPDPEPEPEPEIELVKVPYHGVEFTIPKEMDEWEVEACLAMNQGNYILSAKLLLGPAQWAGLQAMGSRRKDMREFLAVFADVIDKECIA